MPNVDDGAVRLSIEMHCSSLATRPPGLAVHRGERHHTVEAQSWVRSRPEGVGHHAREPEP
jgi:hypothetical protein